MIEFLKIHFISPATLLIWTWLIAQFVLCCIHTTLGLVGTNITFKFSQFQRRPTYKILFDRRVTANTLVLIILFPSPYTKLVKFHYIQYLQPFLLLKNKNLELSNCTQDLPYIEKQHCHYGGIMFAIIHPKSNL